MARKATVPRCSTRWVRRSPLSSYLNLRLNRSAKMKCAAYGHWNSLQGSAFSSLKRSAQIAIVQSTMALADRYYMREEYHPPRICSKLIVVLILAFVVQSALLIYGGIDLSTDFGLTVAGLAKGKVWQLLTFQFLHACPWPWHVLFNCLAQYFFGRPVEETLGPKRFILLYLLAGVAGGLL